MHSYSFQICYLRNVHFKKYMLTYRGNKNSVQYIIISNEKMTYMCQINEESCMLVNVAI